MSVICFKEKVPDAKEHMNFVQSECAFTCTCKCGCILFEEIPLYMSSPTCPPTNNKNNNNANKCVWFGLKHIHVGQVLSLKTRVPSPRSHHHKS